MTMFERIVVGLLVLIIAGLGAAFYTDQYVKRDDAWLIAQTGYKRTYEELVPRGSVAGLRLTADWWATGGRSTLG